MSDLQNDKEVLNGKRRNPLQDDPDQGLEVVATLRDQQLEKLAKKLEDMDVGNKIVQMWNIADADRAENMERQQEYLTTLEEFIDPIYTPAMDWSSTLHLPTVLTVCKTFHARMYYALWGIDPPFSCIARQPGSEDRAIAVQGLMRWALKDWCNDYEGIESELDRWIWYWVTKGDAYIKQRWHKKFTSFEDVDSLQVEDVRMERNPETGDSEPVPYMKEVQKNVVKTEMVYEGPMIQVVANEDIIVIGGDGVPSKADATIEQCWYTASELWSNVDQKLFRKDAVEAAIEGGKDYVAGSSNSTNIKQEVITQSGRGSLDRTIDTDRYRILEAYLKLDVNGSGIDSDVIVWVHARSRQILRATYLRRVRSTGSSPYSCISFHKRYGTEYSVGLPEMLHSLGKEIDAIHNINMDIGILTSMPFGFYRPTSSSLKEEALKLEPGALIPVNDPQTDVMFPNMGLRTAFGFQEEQALSNYVERLTSISDLNFGVLGAQGVARTATGARALLGESSNNLNIYVQRMNRGWKSVLHGLFEMLQDRIPPGLMFRIEGDDGGAYWSKIESRQEICGSYDFELEGNSANSNKQIQVEQANLLYQVTGDPINLQLGITTPSNRYEALVNMLKINGIKAVGKYATKPQGYGLSLSPVEIADRLLAGVEVQFSPTMDLQGFIALVEEFMQSEDLNGQLGPQHLAVLRGKAQEAQALIDAVQQQQATAAVQQQQLANTQASQTPGNVLPMSVEQQPRQGMGG